MTTVLWYSDGNHNFTASNAWNQAADGSGTAGNPDTDDRVIIQSGDTVTLDNNVTIGTCGISGTLTGNTSYSLTLAGSSEDFNYSNSGTVTNLNIIMTGLRASGDRSMIDIGSGIRNLTLNDATNSGNNVHHIASNLSISGDLTITEGTLNTGHGGTDRALTVTGNIDVDGGNLNVNDSAVSCAKLIVESGDTITAAHSSNALTVTGTGIGDNRSIDFTGAISGTLDIITTHTGTREDDLSASSGVVNHLTVNHASAVMRMNASYTVGNLTITAGQFTTADAGGNSKALTVTGKTLIDGGTLTCNASTISLKSGVDNDIFGLQVASGTFNGGTGTHTIGGIRVSGGTLTFTSGNTTINAAETSSSAGAIYISGSPTVNTSSGTVIIDTSGTKQFLLYNSNLTLHNLTINSGSAIRLWQPTSDGSGTELLTVAGDLTINGTLDTDFSSNDDVNLTVTGTTTVNGTLTCNASTISLGSGKTDGYGLNVASGGTFTGGTGTHTWGSANLQASTTLTSGTTTIDSAFGTTGFWADTNFTHNSGTVAFTRNGDQKFGESGTDTPTRTFNHLIVNKAGGELTWVDDHPFACVVAGNLTITAGELDTGPDNVALTVTGDASVTGTLTGNASAISLGSLTIASGGTFIATSGTTTLTGKNGSNYMLENSGTFTHNKGTVKFEADTSSGTWYATSASNVEANSIQFYNLETVRTGSAGSYRFFVGGNSFYLVVLNNLTIGVNTNIHSSNGTSILRHYGAFFNIEGSASFDNVTDVQCGLITIGSAGVLEIDNGDQAISCTGIRNLRGSAGIQA